MFSVVHVSCINGAFLNLHIGGFICVCRRTLIDIIQMAGVCVVLRGAV